MVPMGDKVHNEVRTQRFLQGEMTQQELAERVGVSRQTVIAVEKGKYNPSVGLALRIASVFGMSVEELFSLDEAGGEIS